MPNIDERIARKQIRNVLEAYVKGIENKDQAIIDILEDILYEYKNSLEE